MDISDLKTSISKMSQSEAFELIKETRFLRRQPPKKKSTKKSTKQKPVSTDTILKSLTREQKLKLLEQLGGK